MSHDQKVDVRSWEELEALEAAICRFAARAEEITKQCLTRLYEEEQLLLNLRDQQQQAVDAAKTSYESCDSDEDDCDTYFDEWQEEDRRLRELESQCQQMHAALERARHSGGRLKELLENTVGRSQDTLKKKLQILREYQAMQIQDLNATSRNMRPPPAPRLAAAITTELGAPENVSIPHSLAPAPADFPNYPLPRGFVWLPLEKIDLDTELAEIHGPLDWKKGVSMEEMREGLETFRTRILPHLLMNPQKTNSEYFWRLDQQEGRAVANGLQRIYDAFFGRDCLYLERGRGSINFEVISGKHRLKLGRDLGWTVIPARIKDMNEDV